ncbi:MAG: carbamoyltransferase HypF [Pyrinomonadaceae bacterium]
MKTRTQIQIKGIVQGVGFRPFVFALAAENSLKGRVLNNAVGVLVDVEGEDENVEQFINSIKTSPPPLSFIESVTQKNISEKANFQTFQILTSESNGNRFVPVSPDIATCADCLREMFDAGDRRYLYPFINCTNCGPRFTIIENIPYDRAQTTMRDFKMCAECLCEYENPLDRRFHAEPTCCPKCGPKVFLSEPSAVADGLTQNTRHSNGNSNTSITKLQPSATADGSDSIKKTQELLQAGKIVAVKGIGGFHLVCDARNDAALQTLRERKGRVDKPFAVMCKSLETAKNLVEISESEEKFLTGKERPIVLLKKRESGLSELIAPGNHFLGVMLAYAPLHYLLFESDKKTPDVLVMTSGNFSNEPIVKDNDEALEKLAHLADAFLLHDREIYVPCDDSVIRILTAKGAEDAKKEKVIQTQIYKVKKRLKEYSTNDRISKKNFASSAPFAVKSSQILPIRRSRGYAPFPVKLPFDVPNILAVGGELKAAFCLTREDYAFMSQHIGDMENLETLHSFERSFEQMKNLFQIEPEIIACDKHPGYLSSNWARKVAENSDKIKLVEVQHHRAHIASVMAENGLQQDEKVIGFAFDGTGFGDDGAIWGGEVFIGDYAHFERVAQLEYFPLSGGDAAIKKPYRVALGLLREAGIEWNEHLDCVSFCTETERRVLAKQLENNLNTIPTSSFGRLFDAVASMANVRQKITYEAQAAIEFEALIDEEIRDFYHFDLTEGDILKINWKNLIREIEKDVSAEIPVSAISAKFHNAVANLILDLSRKMRERFALNRVALSGGCFQNVALLQKAIALLSENEFEVFTHEKVPPNDGGLALGQAVIASQLL